MTELEQIKNDLVKIQERINKLENPAFEVGKWYKDKTSNILFFTEKVNQSGLTGYGFGTGNNWLCSAVFFGGNMDDAKKDLILATDKEVEEALIKEAKRRGVKEGVKYKPVNYHEIVEVGNGSFVYDKSENKLLYYSWACFKDGKWAEIIKDEPIKIGGHKVKKYDSNYKIGCKLFTRESISSLAALMYEQDFETVSFDGIETDLETINKILTL